MEHRISLALSVEEESTQSCGGVLEYTSSTTAHEAQIQGSQADRLQMQSSQLTLPKQSLISNSPEACQGGPDHGWEKAWIQPATSFSINNSEAAILSPADTRISPLAPQVSSSVDHLSVINATRPIQTRIPISSVPSPPDLCCAQNLSGNTRPRRNNYVGPFHLSSAEPSSSCLSSHQLFWWGFICPPLWVWGAMRLNPCNLRKGRMQSRESHLKKSMRDNQGGNICQTGKFSGVLTRIFRPFRKNEIQVGTTAIIVVPRSNTGMREGSCSSARGSASELSWQPGCISPAERLDAAGVDSSEWLHSGCSNEKQAEDQVRREKKGSIKCLVSITCFALLVTVVVVVSIKVHPANLYSARSIPSSTPQPSVPPSSSAAQTAINTTAPTLMGYNNEIAGTSGGYPNDNDNASPNSNNNNNLVGSNARHSSPL
ncbi:hypothetical protein BY996DRAFT_6410228 [Phakopsora pachyrhizi]|uniref:Expressed protein n=1 Tax=Phakopsora pachyrhizi TaxID=170000 RepID=A0AAV0AXI9_PHAPC|nr:hypothetical protein BY996DRAFT_6410228 [Phakopsora pachyrhizi]CAH7674001.1 expressed protein [Phakopsora pachyrhizi]CAH7684380.1 expressed protein [Phakopsora pachyrhizi]